MSAKKYKKYPNFPGDGWSSLEKQLKSPHTASSWAAAKSSTLLVPAHYLVLYRYASLLDQNLVPNRNASRPPVQCTSESSWRSNTNAFVQCTSGSGWRSYNTWRALNSIMIRLSKTGRGSAILWRSLSPAFLSECLGFRYKNTHRNVTAYVSMIRLHYHNQRRPTDMS